MNIEEKNTHEKERYTQFIEMMHEIAYPTINKQL